MAPSFTGHIALLDNIGIVARAGTAGAPRNFAVKPLPVAAESGAPAGGGDAKSGEGTGGYVRGISLAIIALLAGCGLGLTSLVVINRMTGWEHAAQQECIAGADGAHTRHVRAVKKHLKGLMARSEPSRSTYWMDVVIPRDDALAAVDVVVKKPGLYMLYGPMGEGKSGLVHLLESKYPCVIRVCMSISSMDLAVRHVAEAIGYSYDMHYKERERVARSRGLTVPSAYGESPLAKELYREVFYDLLRVFEQACQELRAEGCMRDSVPVLVLDDANRHEKISDGVSDNMIAATMAHANRFPEERASSLVLVTIDPQQEHESWMDGSDRDITVQALRAPPFSEAQADDMMVQLILKHQRRVNSRPASPAAEAATAPPAPDAAGQAAAIRRDYASTLSFARGAVGTRARRLEKLLFRLPLSDEQLKSGGVAVEPAYYPFLPNELHHARVDPAVYQEFKNMVTARKGDFKPLLEVPHRFALRPEVPWPPFNEADLFAQRVLAVDCAMRVMLNATAPPETATAGTASSAAVAARVGVMFETLKIKYFEDHPDDLRALFAADVLFYDRATGTVEFESDLMRRVVADTLADPRHQRRIELVRKLQEWQLASADAAAATAHAEAREEATGSVDRGKAIAKVQRVMDLNREIEALRTAICPYRNRF